MCLYVSVKPDKKAKTYYTLEKCPVCKNEFWLENGKEFKCKNCNSRKRAYGNYNEADNIRQKVLKELQTLRDIFYPKEIPEILVEKEKTILERNKAMANVTNEAFEITRALQSLKNMGFQLAPADYLSYVQNLLRNFDKTLQFFIDDKKGVKN